MDSDRSRSEKVPAPAQKKAESESFGTAEEAYFANPVSSTTMPAPQQMALERWRRQLNAMTGGEGGACAVGAATNTNGTGMTAAPTAPAAPMWNPGAMSYFNMSYVPQQMHNFVNAMGGQAVLQHQLNMAAFTAAQQQQQRQQQHQLQHHHHHQQQQQQQQLIKEIVRKNTKRPPPALAKSPVMLKPKPAASDTSAATSHKELSDDDEGAERAAASDEKVLEVPQKVVIEKPIFDESLPKPVPGKICAYCRAQKTPLWRNGPFGPKTLCNACGVRFKLGKLAGTEDGFVVNVIVPRQKRRKNGSVPRSKVSSSATANITAPSSSGVEVPLKVRNTFRTKRIPGLGGGGVPKADGPLRVASPFLVNEYDGASLLMVLAGENDKKEKGTDPK